jgi:hypothetical protein
LRARNVAPGMPVPVIVEDRAAATVLSSAR